MKKWLEKWGLAAILLLVLSSFTVSSQDDRRSRRLRRAAGEAVADTIAVPEISDSLRAVRDSIARVDSLAAADSISMLRKSSLEAPAFTAARDSIVEDFSDGKRMIYYYGDVSVTYGNMKLTADYMEYAEPRIQPESRPDFRSWNKAGSLIPWKRSDTTSTPTRHASPTW